MKALNGLQLKAANLRRRHTLLCHPQGFCRISIPNIANHKHLFIEASQDLPNKSCRRRLPIRPRNRSQPAFSKTISQLHFPPDQSPIFTKLPHQRKIHRHTRAQDHHFRLLFHLIRKLPKNNAKPIAIPKATPHRLL